MTINYDDSMDNVSNVTPLGFGTREPVLHIVLMLLRPVNLFTFGLCIVVEGKRIVSNKVLY